MIWYESSYACVKIFEMRRKHHELYNTKKMVKEQKIQEENCWLCLNYDHFFNLGYLVVNIENWLIININNAFEVQKENNLILL